MTLQKVILDIKNTLKDYPEFLEQTKLYLNLVNNRISLDDYFIEQAKIDLKYRKNCVPIFWKQLKVQNQKTYDHELRHFKVWKKYGVKATLCRLIGTGIGDYCVIDEDFQEVTRRNNFGRDQVIKILGEMTQASFKNILVKDRSYLGDIFWFEILNKGIKDLSNFKLAIAKYVWSY